MDGVKIQLEEDKTDIICELCGRQMVVKQVATANSLHVPVIPNARISKRLSMKQARNAQNAAPSHCEKKTKKGRVFYGCKEYPNCDFVSWDEPSMEKCPQCGKTLLKKKR